MRLAQSPDRHDRERGGKLGPIGTWLGPDAFSKLQ